MIRRITPLALCASALVIAISANAAGGVLVVGPGQAHAEIAGAVAAAGQGDVVLVKGGAYDNFMVDAKGITIVAEVGAVVFVTGAIVVKNVPATRTVVLDRLRGDSGLFVKDCVGPVRVQTCVIWGTYGTGQVSACASSGLPDGGSAVTVTNSDDVALTQCELYGGQGSYMFDSGCTQGVWIGGNGGPALKATNSIVTVSESLLKGGLSGTGSYSESGGDGIRALASSLVLVDVAATGGEGGLSLTSVDPGPGGSGGHGIYLDSGSQARVLDSTMSGGIQGPGLGEPGGQQQTGIGGFGTITNWTGSAKGFGAFKVVREGQTLVAGMTGIVGETALLFASPRTVSLLIPQAKGVFMLDPSILVGPVALGVVTGPGQVALNVVVPPLPPGVLGTDVYLQGLLSGPAGATLTSWGHVALLDASF